ncbi:Na(+)/H(+) antiporter subunit D [Halovenus rubra]|uniref:Na(+)/H(+) antiporter subunit D n=2 Tax=Halovenus rubra TaxID=869890 RepID=A0ABD5X8N3_9EURY|nr:Na(+)/H(+) antiporter subunit D [Halovenus rubra]
MVLESIPPFAIVLIAAVLVPVLPRRLGHAIGVLATGSVAAISLVIDEGTHLSGFELFGTFDVVIYNVDQFSRLMGLIFGFIAAVAVLYSYASDADSIQTAFALSYVGVSLGTVYAGDWLTLIFFWELMAVTSTLLVWHYGGDAVRSGFRYAMLHGIGGSLFLAAIVWHYANVGAVAFTGNGITGTVPATLAAIGIGVNVGFVGLHAWLPDTYPSPHLAASVFLCVYTTKTGVYGMYRAFPDGHIWIAYMGGAMAVFGAFAALLQSDMRRLLSYHIQSQVGYMIAGVGLAGGAIGHGGHDKYYDVLAAAGTFGHVFNHILYKGLLFMTVGVIIYRTGQESLDNIGGLGRKMPITAITFTIAALSIAGFPGFNGFVSKGMIIGAAHKKHLDILWYLLLLGGVGTFLSFIKLGYFAFIEGSYDGVVKDANIGQSVSMVSVAGLCVLFGLRPTLLFELLPFQGQYEYTTYTASHITEGLVLAGAGAIGFAVLRGPLHHIGRVPDIDSLYNRGFFYGGRVLIVAVTELYAFVDRVAVGLVRNSYWVGANPTLAVARTARYLPQSVRPSWDDEQPQADGGAPPRLYLRAGIGTSVLLLATVLTIVLLVVL